MSLLKPFSERCRQGARAPLSAAVLGSRRCPVCQEAPIHAGQEVCSGKCRAARSRQRKAQARTARDQALLAALDQAEALHQRAAEILQAVRCRLEEEL